MDSLKKGDRVTVTVGARPTYHGVITGEGRRGIWWLVLKDGLMTPIAIHKDFCRRERVAADQ